MRKIQLKVVTAKPARTARPVMFCIVVATETKTPKTHQTRVFGQTGWVGCAPCEKTICKFCCHRNGQNGPPRRNLHSCSVRNGSSQNGTNMSFGLTGVRSSRKIEAQFFSIPTRTALPGEFSMVVRTKTETPERH